MTESARVEPEPIDAEFEPAENAPQLASAVRRTAPRGLRSRAVTWRHLLTASGISAVAGATVAIIVSNAQSNAPTGTLAREIDSLTQTLDDLQARANQAGVDIVSLRSRMDAHGDRLNRSDSAEASLRTDIGAIASQVSAISGAGDGAAPEGAAANSTALGVLLARINKLERIVADATSAPATTREVQRAVADLAIQVAELNLANTTLTTAFDRREASLAALETGMQAVATQLGGQHRSGAPLVTVAAMNAPPQPIVDATTRARTIRALSVLEAAARTDSSFAEAHQALSELIPGDASLSQIAGVAASGAPTLTTLRTTFEASATRAMRHASEESDDGWNWLRQAFDGVVNFETSALETRTAGSLRTARRQLDVGAIRDAVTAVSGLPGRAEADFAGWREKALQRAALDDALKALNARVLAAPSVAPPAILAPS